MQTTCDTYRQLQLPEVSTLRPGPRCSKCSKPGPTINGRCGEHLDVATEGRLSCLSPADLDLPGL